MRQMHYGSRLRLVLLAAVLLLASGCTALKASPAKDAGFLPQPQLVKEQRERAPFNGYWASEDLRRESQQGITGKLYVAPIDTVYLENQLTRVVTNERLRTRRLEEAQEIARYFRERLRMSLKQKGNGALEVVEEAGPHARSLEVALVEVVPTNPGFSVAGTAAGFLVPGGGLLKLIGQGSVAFEGYVKDLQSGAVFEQFKDRETDRSSPFSVKDYQQYAHVRAAVDDWAEQIAELLTTPQTHRVEDSLPFSLSPL